MGRPDQLAKRILTKETPEVTGRRVTFEVPPEVPVGALQPDGVVRVVFAPGLRELPAPWSRLRGQATVDVKMPGDHIDRAALARCELRRHARWVQLLEATPAPEHPDPRDVGDWIVSPNLPEHVRADAARGVYELDAVATGCWRLGLGVHETLWIAANHLPLRAELVPFLVARSGSAQDEFLLWAAEVKGLEWTLDVVKELRMTSQTADDLLHLPVDEDEQRRVKTEFTRRLLAMYPDAANEILEKAREDGVEKALGALTRQFERKLSRTLDAAEHMTLVRRLDTHGAARLGDVVLDLSAVELDAWLRDPAAK